MEASMTPAAKRRIKQDKIRRCQRGTGKRGWRVKFLTKCGERALGSVLPTLGRGVARGAKGSPEAVRGGAAPRAPTPPPRGPGDASPCELKLAGASLLWRPRLKLVLPARSTVRQDPLRAGAGRGGHTGRS